MEWKQVLEKLDTILTPEEAKRLDESLKEFREHYFNRNKRFK